MIPRTSRASVEVPEMEFVESLVKSQILLLAHLCVNVF